MNNIHYGRSEIGAKFSEIIVLSLSFLLFALFSNNVDLTQIMICAALYSVINLFFLRLARALLSKLNSSPIVVVNLLVENLIGLTIGGIIAFHLIKSLVGLDNVMMILVFSSIMTFFVLGTFTPLMETQAKSVARR